MREIITVQVGDFANFVGSHVWNFQDELLGLADDPGGDPIFKNHYLAMDSLYRTGETREGNLTYTPRLVSVNFPGSLGSVSSRGTLYNQTEEVPSQAATWRGGLSIQKDERRKRNLFLQSLHDEEQPQSSAVHEVENNTGQDLKDEDIVESLENSAEFWTDYSKVHYHPQSMYELNGLWMDSKEFNNYGIGKDAFSENSRGEEISDRLRFFIEECDQIQGIQFMVDDSGGFSSLAADFLETIADEYSNTPVLLYSARDPRSFISSRSQKRNVLRDLHDAVSFSRLSSFCKLFVPIGLPFLNDSRASSFLHVNDEKAYHSSAVYASALHTLSLPYRMELSGPTSNSNLFCGALDMNAFIQILSGQPRQNIVMTLDAAIPAPPLTGEQGQQPLLSSLQTLSPDVDEGVEDSLSVESLVVNGILHSGGKRAQVSEVRDIISSSYGQCANRPRFCHLSVSPCPLPIPLPFPSIFNHSVGQHGELSSGSVSDSPVKGSLQVHSIPMAARLRSSKAILPFMSTRLENLRRCGIRRGAPGSELLRSWGFEKDELDDMDQNLAKMVSDLDPDSYTLSDSD